MVPLDWHTASGLHSLGHYQRQSNNLLQNTSVFITAVISLNFFNSPLSFFLSVSMKYSTTYAPFLCFPFYESDIRKTLFSSW